MNLLFFAIVEAFVSFPECLWQSSMHSPLMDFVGKRLKVAHFDIVLRGVYISLTLYRLL